MPHSHTHLVIQLCRLCWGRCEVEGGVLVMVGGNLVRYYNSGKVSSWLWCLQSAEFSKPPALGLGLDIISPNRIVPVLESEAQGDLIPLTAPCGLQDNVPHRLWHQQVIPAWYVLVKVFDSREYLPTSPIKFISSLWFIYWTALLSFTPQHTNCIFAVFQCFGKGKQEKKLVSASEEAVSEFLDREVLGEKGSVSSVLPTPLSLPHTPLSPPTITVALIFTWRGRSSDKHLTRACQGRQHMYASSWTLMTLLWPLCSIHEFIIKWELLCGNIVL